jgi:hypothetical protein
LQTPGDVAVARYGFSSRSIRSHQCFQAARYGPSPEITPPCTDTETPQPTADNAINAVITATRPGENARLRTFRASAANPRADPDEKSDDRKDDEQCRRSGHCPGEWAHLEQDVTELRTPCCRPFALKRLVLGLAGVSSSELLSPNAGRTVRDRLRQRSRRHSDRRPYTLSGGSAGDVRNDARGRRVHDRIQV